MDGLLPSLYAPQDQHQVRHWRVLAGEGQPFLMSAGIAILRGRFDDETAHPMLLLLAALRPTIIAALVFRYL